MIDEFVRSMTYPFLACLLLAGMHVYLGIHVIERKVIFVDLALAQIAALGAVFGVVLGYGLEEDPWAVKAFSLGFAIVGAAVFSITRMRHERVPQEAIIGVTYAVAVAGTILASAHLPHGREGLGALLAGSILWVRGETILHTALLFGAIGVFHFIFRRRFLMISIDPARAEAEGMGIRQIRLWDFLFYISFGFVVTTAVAIAGVLLVFSYLVIPAVIAVLFAKGIGARLTIGWIVGALVSFIGVTISYKGDLPSGPTIVVTFGGSLLVAGIIYYLIHARSTLRAALRVGAGVLIFLALAALAVSLRKKVERTPLDLVRSPIKNEQLIGLKAIEADAELWRELLSQVPDLLGHPEAEIRSAALGLIGKYEAEEFLPQVHALLSDPDDLVREEVLRSLRSLESEFSIGPLLARLAVEEDEFLKVEMAECVLELGDPRGIPALLDIMDEGEVSQVRKDAHEHLIAHTKLDFPFSADPSPGSNDDQIEPYRRWWRENAEKLEWEPSSRVFRPNLP